MIKSRLEKKRMKFRTICCDTHLRKDRKRTSQNVVIKTTMVRMLDWIIHQIVFLKKLPSSQFRSLNLLTCQGSNHELKFRIVSDNDFCHVTCDKMKTRERKRTKFKTTCCDTHLRKAREPTSWNVMIKTTMVKMLDWIIHQIESVYFFQAHIHHLTLTHYLNDLLINNRDNFCGERIIFLDHHSLDLSLHSIFQNKEILFF